MYYAMQHVKSGLYQKDDTSIHNVPILVIKRKDGRLRLAYDLTKLNAHTKDVQSHIPTYNWLFQILRGHGLTTTSDVKNFFENILLRKKDRSLCAVTTPIGRYHLTHATYGFKNIATKAQEISNAIVQPLGRAGAFIDDLFMKHEPNASDNELLRKAEKFLKRAREIGVLLHPEKTFFFVEEIEFLGYIFTQHGTRPTPRYINKVLNVKKPQTTKEIQAYLGLLQYIARYVHKFAEWSHYLTALTRKDTKIKWGTAQDVAFNELQKRINNIKLLSHPTDEDEFLVQTDASKYAIAAVLFQHQYDPQIKHKQWKIIEFYSKQLDPHLVKHPIMVKECLAFTYALNHWKHFLLRKKFYLDTDHKNLVSLYDDDETKAPEMRKKQIFVTMRAATAMYHFKLAHLSGSNVILADYLSRDGSKFNEITGHVVDHQVNLITIESDNVHEHLQTMQTMLKISHHREVYQKHVQHPNIITNISECKARYNQMGESLQHLDLEYIKENGYVTPSTINLKPILKNDDISKKSHLVQNVKNSLKKAQYN